MIEITKIDSANLILSFPFNYEYIRLIKSLPRRIYLGNEKKWKVPTLDYAKLVNLLDEHKIPHMFTDNSKKIKSIYGLYQPKLKLYPEQEECAQFALNNDNVILNMSIGFGKTSVALITALTKKKLGKCDRVLIVVPSSLKRQWIEEIKKFTDETYNLIDGTPDKRIYNSNAFFTITSFALVRRDIVKIRKINWDLLIVDEIVRIKNHKTKTSMYLNQVPYKHRLALTGAILENRIEELYNILNFIRPKTFASYWDFASRFLQRRYIDRPYGKFWETYGIKNLDHLRDIMGDFVIKKELTDLPEKHEKTYSVPMTKSQREVYNETVEECIEQLMTNQNPLAKLMYLREVCNSPELIGYSGKSNKIEELKKILKETNGKKVVIFSQFKKFVDLIFKELLGEKIIPVHGGLNGKEKQLRIDIWKEQGKILLCTDCLGYGHNLQDASILINMDTLWNPMRMQQRTGRIWRRGQKNGCLIINIISEDSVEERVLGILNQKLELINNVLNEDNIKFQISRKEELLSLLRGGKK